MSDRLRIVGEDYADVVGADASVPEPVEPEPEPKSSPYLPPEERARIERLRPTNDPQNLFQVRSTQPLPEWQTESLFARVDPDELNTYTVMTALADPVLGENPGLAKLVAAQLLNFDNLHPEVGLRAIMDTEMDRALRMTDAERITASIDLARADPTFDESDLLDRTINELATMFSEVENYVRSGEDVFTDRETRFRTLSRLTSRDVKTVAERVTDEIADAMWDDMMAVGLAESRDQAIVKGSDVVFGDFADFGPAVQKARFEDALADEAQREITKFTGREGGWFFDKDFNQLVVALRTDNPQGRDPGQPNELLHYTNLKLDEGTRIESFLDVLAALVYADLGVAHQIVEGGDMPGKRTVAGIVTKGVGDALRLGSPMLNVPASVLRQKNVALYGFAFGGADPDTETVDDQIAQLRAEYESATGTVTDQQMLVAAAQYLRELEPGLSDKEVAEGSVSFWANLPEEQRTQARMDVLASIPRFEDDPTIRAELEELVDERTSTEKYVDEAFGQVIQGMMWWEQVIHRIAMEVVRNMPLLPEVLDVAADVLEPFSNIGVFDASEAMRLASERIGEHDPADYEYMSEWMGIDEVDPTLAFWTDMTTSIVADPLTYVFGSSKAVRAGLTGMMTTRPGALKLRSTHQWKAYAKGLVKFNRSARYAKLLDDGMEGDLLQRAVDAADYAELEKVMYEALPINTPGSGFLPDMGWHLSRRNSAAGWSQFLTRKGAQKDGRIRNIVRDLGLNASRNTSASVSKDFLADASAAVQQFFAHDATKFDEWMRKAIVIWDRFKNKPVNQLRLLSEASDALKAEIREIRHQFPDGITQWERKQAERARLVEDLAPLQRERNRLLAESGADVLQINRLNEAVDAHSELIKNLDEWFASHADIEDMFDDYLAQMADPLDRLSVLNEAIAVLSDPQSRAEMINWWDEMVEAAAKDAGAPDARTIAREMRGDTGKSLRDSLDDLFTTYAKAQREAGKYSNISPKRFEEVMRDNFNRTVRQVNLPLSPQELIMWKHGWGKSGFIRGANRVAEVVHRFFVSNVLLNPMTIIRSNMDDPLRMGITFGTRGRLVRTGLEFDDLGNLITAKTKGTPGVLRNPSLLSMVAPPVGPFGKMWRRYFDYLDGFGREQAMKELVAPFDYGRPSAWVMVGPDAKGVHTDAVRHFTNAIMNNDPAIPHFARIKLKELDGAGDFADEWARYWDDIGGDLRFNAKITRSEKAEDIRLQIAERDDYYQALSNFFELFTGGGKTQREFLEALASGKEISYAAARQINMPVPALPYAGFNPRQDIKWFQRLRQGSRAATSRKGHLPDRLTNGIWHAFFERPAGHRRGIAFQVFFDEALEGFTQAWGKNILTPARLVEGGLARTPQEARSLLARGSSRIDELVEAGWLTTGEVERQAYKYANRMTEQMMYQPAFSSLAGRSAFSRTLWPFGKAHVDFLTWYGRQLTNGSWLSLQPWMRRGLSRASRGAISATGTPRRIPGLPLNVRLLSRMSTVLSETHRQINANIEASRTEFDPGTKSRAFGPGQLIKDFTFLPWQFDQNMLIDLVPGMGPVPSFLIHWLEPDHWLRREVESFFPAQEFNPRQVGWQDMWEFVLSPEGGSVVGNTRALLAGIPIDEDQYGVVGQVVEAARMPRWRNAHAEAVLIDYLLDDQKLLGELGLKPFDVQDPELDRFAELMDPMLEEASRRAGQTQLRRHVKKLQPFYEFYNPDALQVKALTGFMEELDRMVKWGFVAEDRAADMRDVWRRIGNDSATDSERRAFIQWGRDVVFADTFPRETADWLIAKHPEFAVNTVGHYQCVVDDDGRIVGDFGSIGSSCQANGTPRWPIDGELARDAVREAVNKGWVEARAMTEIYQDVVYRVAEARSAVLRDMIKNRTGKNSVGLNKREAAASMELFPLTRAEQEVLAKLGIADVASAETLGEFKEQLERSYKLPQKPFDDNEFVSHTFRIGNRSEAASRFYDTFKLYETGEVVERNWTLPEEFEDGYGNPWEWPEEAKEEMRRLAGIVFLDPEAELTKNDYRRHLSRWFGDIDFVAPEPPSVSDLDWYRAFPRRDVAVIDGDTVRVRREGEWEALRIIGINAPDKGQLGHGQAISELRRVLDGATEIGFGAFDPERFGVINFPDPDRSKYRLKLWLYVDGKPIYDPSVFTSSNPQGILPGGTFVRLTEEPNE